MRKPSASQRQYTIAFYNLENLFDTINDPQTLDDDFTPSSEKKWTEKRYRKKTKKMGRVISQIGYSETTYPPLIVGLAEVENKKVLENLVDSKFLKEKEYDFVHFDSPDERGIDTALLYRKEYFEILHTEAFNLHLLNEEGIKDYTRDILYVKGKLEDETVHILVNHWPSRRKGTDETAYKRIAAAKRNLEIIAGIYEQDPHARILIMGDFNDDPKSESLKTLVTNEFYNPMELLLTKYSGSLNYKGAWNLFDQIILSHNFLRQHGNNFRFLTAKVFSPEDIREYKGKYKGNPFRTYVGKKYLGGFSDHFPVYSVLTIE